MARPVYLAAFLLLASGLFLAADKAGDAKGPFNASGLGIAEVRGRPVLVEVFVALKSGANAEAEIRAALRERGARPLEKSEYTTTGLVWNQFSDSDSANDYVTQYYNGSNSPVGGNGLTALTNTHSTWTNVSTSSAAFQYGGQTTRCPSLVQECPGDQTFDGLNDVAWLDLGRCSFFRCTLAVTWFSTSDPDEADMAMNTRVSWATNGSDYDAETVFLHENGHVVGLGHSEVTQAIMYAYYSGVRRTLHQDDIDGISALYPSGGGGEEDTTPPDTFITSAPSDPSASPDATFEFTSSEAGSTFECSLDSAAFSPCSSPAEYTGLADGPHSFEVRATDGSGNTDSTPASYSWTIDTTAPPPADISVAGIEPGSLPAGSTNVITVSGSGFVDGAEVTFQGGSGSAPTATNESVNSDGSMITASLTIKAGGPPRERPWEVVVTNPDGSSGSCSCFTVTP
jgi:hypothetical protein